MKCKRCDGTGKETDQRLIGAAMKRLRQRRGIGLREMARLMFLSHTHIKLLEKGERRWSPALHNLYKSTINTYKPCP